MLVINDIGNHLKEHEIKPSIQRIKIFEFLMNSIDHPTVEQIFSALSTEIPTLSKTTVYNTLRLFQTQGIVNIVNIEDNETRFDWDTSFHGHFKCKNCGMVKDFQVDFNQIKIKEVEDHIISESHFYLKGICKTCQIK